MEKLDKIREEISKPLEKLEIVVDSIEYVKLGSMHSLNIVLDKVNGIDLDTIEKATHIINPIIDRLDLFDESYVLDISSKERGNSNE